MGWQWFLAKALATWLTQNLPSKVTRVYSYLGNPNLLAGYLPVVLSLMAFAWRGWVPKTLAVTMFCVNAACLVLTFSRGG